uniref:Uncharacterized protein n=1 Tax=Anguilla anguilla TaxID=7936 RepID=A0A0E9XQI5_ANGAN
MPPWTRPWRTSTASEPPGAGDCPSAPSLPRLFTTHSHPISPTLSCLLGECVWVGRGKGIVFLLGEGSIENSPYLDRHSVPVSSQSDYIHLHPWSSQLLVYTHPTMNQINRFFSRHPTFEGC